MALSRELRDFTGGTSAKPQGEKLRGGQIGLCAGEFDGICAFLPEQLLSEPHRASESAKHLIVAGRDPGIGFIDCRRRDRIIVHHRQHWRVTVDENRAASMRGHDHGANGVAWR